MAPRTPYDSDGDPKLLPSFVCYADVLGYAQESRRALKSGQGELFLKELRDTLNAAYARVRRSSEGFDPEDRMYAVKVFTDNIVVGYPIADVSQTLGEPELGHAFSTFIELQAGLAMAGYFIRGGIAMGAHYMDDDIVFGDALLDAVQMDKSGGPPRLTLTSSAVDMVRGHIGFYRELHGAPHYEDLLEDADGTIFVNYLNAAFEVFPDGGVFFEVIERHRNMVRANLERFKGVPGVRSKFEWAARYHNFVCRDFLDRHPVPSGPDASEPYASAASDAQRLVEYFIDEVELAVAPRRIALTPLF